MNITSLSHNAKTLSKLLIGCSSLFPALCAGILLAFPTHAAVLSWSGGSATSGNWSDNQNWGFAGIPANGDTLIFPASQPRLTNTNDLSGLTLNQIRFVGASGGYSIYGNSFTLTGSIQATNTAGTNNAINNPITLSTTDIIANVGPAVGLTLSGSLSGSVGITKTGPGTLSLSGSGNNIYSGVTFVKEGTLELNKASGWAIAYGSLVIGDGLGGFKSDIVRYTGSSVSEINTAVALTVKDTGWLDLNGRSDDVGQIDLDNGQIATGSGGLIMTGNLNSYDSSGTNSWGSSISGKITLSGTRAFNVTNGLDITAVVSGSYGLIKAGPGNLYLGSANAYTGLTEVRQGFLWIFSPLSLGTTNNGTVVSNGASLVMPGGFGITNESLTLNGLGANSTWGALDTENGGTNFWVGPIMLNADSTIAPYASGNHLRLLGPVSGAGGLIKGPGSGTLYLEGSTVNTYAGDTVVNNGTLVLNKLGVFDGAIPHDLTINSGATVLYLSVNQIPNNADVYIYGSGLLDLNTSYEGLGAIYGNGRIDLGTQFLDMYDTADCTFNGVISGPGYLNQTLSATGTVILTGTNTYSGPTYANGGKVLIHGYQPQSRVVVGSGGTLGGSGTVGEIYCQGNLTPGTSPGSLTSSNLTFTSTGDFYVELTGSGYDQVIVHGTNNLANATLHVIPSFTRPVAVGQQFIIVNNDLTDAITGTFTGLPNGASFLAGDIGFRINYNGGDGNDVVLTVLNSPGASVTINATDSGWYDRSGTHNAGNNNYYVGDSAAATESHRNWFVFNLPVFTGSVVKAELLINCSSIFTPYGQETYVLRQVSTPVATLMAGGSGLTNIYNDLANGGVYGVRHVFLAEQYEKAIVPLNLTFIKDATAAMGSQIALGGSLASFDGLTNNQYLFGGSSGSGGAVQLRLTYGISAVTNATSTGWYSETGNHPPGNPNYLAGRSGIIYHNFFAFGLPLFSGQLLNAEILLNSYTNLSAASFLNYQLHEVATPISILTNSASGATDIFADLADGIPYGGREIFVSESGTQLSVPLNSAFIGASSMHSGGQIAVGGAVTPAPASYYEFLFGNSAGNPGDVQLWLGFVPATFPSARFVQGSPTPLGNNIFQFAVSGTPGTTNEIQASTDFVNWDIVKTLYLTNSTGTFNYTNTGFPQRFFRARLLQ